MKNTKMENKEQNKEETLFEKIKKFYNQNKTELYVMLSLLILFNFMCQNPVNKIQSGGKGPENAAMMQGALKDKGGLKSLGKTNAFSTLLSWTYSLLKSFIQFAFLVLTLAVLPGLPVFIFMLILFFILRARVAALKSY